MLATQIVAESSLDLRLPVAARCSSIFFKICSVWPLASAEGSEATMPARYTVLPCTTAWLSRGPTACRLMVIAVSFRFGERGVAERVRAAYDSGTVRPSRRIFSEPGKDEPRANAPQHRGRRRGRVAPAFVLAGGGGGGPRAAPA